MYGVLRYCGARDIAALGAVSTDLALYILQCLVHYRVQSWRLMFPIYLRARYAVHPCAFDIVSSLWFMPFLSRACRVCGKRTQRRVFGTLLCSACTRNETHKCWMIPESIATELFNVFVPVHNGPRCALVFAEHVQAAISLHIRPHTLSRQALVYRVNEARPYRR